MKTENVWHIATKINGRNQYIEHHSVRSDNKIIPSYTDDVLKAREYSSQDHAEAVIKRIHNVFNREFFIEKRTVSANRTKQVKIAGKVI